MDDTYQLTVAFNWDAGSWWISSKTKTVFTINWNTPAPAATPHLKAPGGMVS